jgi:hypothetical protein
MDRCRKCHKPLVLGPSACTHCGEPLFSTPTSGAMPASGAMPKQPGISVSTSSADMSHGSGDAGADRVHSTPVTQQQTWTAPPTPARSMRGVGRLLRVGIVLVVLAGTVGRGLLHFHGGSVSVDRPDIPSFTSPTTTTSTTITSSSGGTVDLPDVAKLPRATPLPKNAFLPDNTMASVSLVRTGDSTSVNFLATGPGSAPTQTVFLSAGFVGAGPIASVSAPAGSSSQGTRSGAIRPKGRIKLGTGSTFEWAASHYKGLDVLVVTIHKRGRTWVLHAGDARGSSETVSGGSPLTYAELGLVASYFHVALAQ